MRLDLSILSENRTDILDGTPVSKPSRLCIRIPLQLSFLYTSEAYCHGISTAFGGNTINVDKSIEGIVADEPEMALAQTNIVILGNKVYLAFTGTSYGTYFACSANIRYIANSEIENRRKKQVEETTGDATIELLENAPSGGVTV